MSCCISVTSSSTAIGDDPLGGLLQDTLALGGREHASVLVVLSVRDPERARVSRRGNQRPGEARPIRPWNPAGT